MPRSTVPVDRAQPRAALLSVGQPGNRSLPSCAHSCTPVDRAVDRPPPPVDRAVDQEHKFGLLNAPFLASLISDLCATSFHLLYLLSPTILHLGEDFLNLSRSLTNSNLSPGEIDTRSRLGICSSVIQLEPECTTPVGELSYMPITERVSNSATT